VYNILNGEETLNDTALFPIYEEDVCLEYLGAVLGFDSDENRDKPVC